MQHRLLQGPFVAAQIDDAVRPYIERLDPEDIAWMRVQLAALLEEDHEAFEALKGAHPRMAAEQCVDRSGERVQLGIDDDEAEAAGG